MKFIFLDPASNIERVLPITPANFSVPHGMKVETVNIHEVGDVALAGYMTLPNYKISCMFPAKAYPFNQPGAILDPYYYVRYFLDAVDSRKVHRWIVSGTVVNSPVLVEEIEYDEHDGTRDVYATLNLHKYRYLTDQAANSATQNASRTDATASALSVSGSERNYTVISGDTLAAVARKFYGNASLYASLATYNGIKNANLISVGQIVKLPDKSLL